MLLSALILLGAGQTQGQESKAVGAVDLLKHYPTTMTTGDFASERARVWQFSAEDIFQVSGFNFDMGQNLRVQAGPSDVGIAHCRDGAVWALLLPRGDGKLTSTAADNPEAISRVWLRFHPAQVNLLFPPETVVGGGDTNLFPLMRAIARQRFPSDPFHAGAGALIPKPDDMIVDADTTDGTRRFFIIDKGTRSAPYVSNFEHEGFKPHPAVTPALAAEAFDKFWDTVDFGCAIFVRRPEVNWTKLRDQYRPKALACSTSDDFADVCAEMLRPLRDLSISLTLAGTDVPVFDRPRVANSNPPAHKAILGNLNRSGRLQWAVTADQIGFVGIYGWDDEAMADQFGTVLDQMRDTRGLIIDVRLNGGSTSERPAQLMAGRFLKKEVIYGYDQFRVEGAYTNLTKRDARKVQPAGPWQYDKPVILLIGQKCMSSTESFIGMMLGDSKVTTMGDHTCGCNGYPKTYELPLEMTLALPRWIDFKPDGKPLDENGFQPQVQFNPGPGAFAGTRDDLLTAALERLRQK